MKHLKTLITLFLLVIGTGMSWAEFKDFEIDLMHETVTLPDGVTATNDGQHGPYYNGEHGWANYVFAFTTNESFKLTLQKCYYGSDAYIKVGNAKTGNVVATLNTKQTEANCDGQVSCVYESDGTEKTFYVLCGPYCHYAKVEKVGGDTPKPQKFGFSIDFMNETVTLPEGVTATNDGQHGPYYNGEHGWANYVFGFTTNKSFKLTLQKCYYGGAACIKVGNAQTGNVVATLDTKHNETNCNGEVSCVYESDGTEKTFYVLCGPYCHFAKVEEVETAAHIHSFTGEWTKTETHHYHVCTAEDCDITDYSAVPAELANYVKYGAHNYKTTVTLPTYYTCTVCGYVNKTLKEDADAVNAVIALIEAIGEVEDSEACKARIDAARKAYDLLSEERQDLVVNYEDLTAAEALLKALTPMDVAEREAIWDWENAKDGDQIVKESFIVHSIGEIHSDIAGLSLEVDATLTSNSYFKATPSGKVFYGSLSAGSTIKVPVRRPGDKVYITCPVGQTSYTVGNVDGKNYDVNKGYTATQADAANGYVLITATGKGNRFYRIRVVQKWFREALPMITLNSAGWASFTSLLRGYVVACPLGAKAYVATAVDDETVTLEEVKHFTYGEGVFIKGEPYAELFANVVDATSSYPEDNNLTVGCTNDVMLYPESKAYIVATNLDTYEGGFYCVKAAINVPAGKAYLYAPNVNAKSLKITFANGAEATGIESVLAGAGTKEPTVFYNLSGQVVGKDYKGIVVGNDGKKYVK